MHRCAITGIVSPSGGLTSAEPTVFLSATELKRLTLSVGAYTFASRATNTDSGGSDTKSKPTVPAVPAPPLVLVRIDLHSVASSLAAADTINRGWICAELALRLEVPSSASASDTVNDGSACDIELIVPCPVRDRTALSGAAHLILVPTETTTAAGGAATSKQPNFGSDKIMWQRMTKLASQLLIGRVVSVNQLIAVGWFGQTARFRIALLTGSGGDTTKANARVQPIFVVTAQTQVRIDSNGGSKPGASGAAGASTRAVAVADESKWCAAVNSTVCGVESEARELISAIRLPLVQPTLYEQWKIWPTHCFLLHGLPGSGKTALAHAIATHSGLSVHHMTGAALYSKYQGDSERHLRDAFDRAEKSAPAIIVIDELDALSPAAADALNAESDSGGVEQRIVSQLRAILDRLNRPHPLTSVVVPAPAAAPPRPHVFVIATTNRLFGVDSSLRRSGRFERLIELRAPNTAARLAILSRHCHSVPFEAASQSVDAASTKCEVLRRVSELTHGFVGADIERLCRDAILCSMRRVKLTTASPTASPTALTTSSGGGGVQISSLALRESDFTTVLQTTRPSNLSSTEFSSVPPSAASASAVGDASPDPFSALGGVAKLVDQLKRSLIAPLQHPERFARFGVRPPRGVLLYGPSGCGKTALAMAAAASCRAQVLCVHSTQLVSSVVGDSERAVSSLFAHARASAPCVIIIDQIESLAPRRIGMPSAKPKPKPNPNPNPSHTKSADTKSADIKSAAAGDESDSDDGEGGVGGGGGSTQFDRILSTLLTEMDGILTGGAAAATASDASDSESDTDSPSHSADSKRRDLTQNSVVIIGTSSLPHRIDPAMLRAGRLDQHLFVPPPDPVARADILHKLTHKMPIDFDVKSAPALSDSDPDPAPTNRDQLIDWMVKRSADFSGADLSNMCKEAVMKALRADINTKAIDTKHFQSALLSTPPSLKNISIHHPID